MASLWRDDVPRGNLPGGHVSPVRGGPFPGLSQVAIALGMGPSGLAWRLLRGDRVGAVTIGADARDRLTAGREQVGEPSTMLRRRAVRPGQGRDRVRGKDWIRELAPVLAHDLELTAARTAAGDAGGGCRAHLFARDLASTFGLLPASPPPAENLEGDACHDQQDATLPKETAPVHQPFDSPSAWAATSASLGAGGSICVIEITSESSA